MFDENKNLKNLKDINSPLPTLPLIKGEEQARLPDGQGGGLSYKKTNKLITALYMVTDIIDENEPLKNKLRTLGIEILSDISTMSNMPLDIVKIDQIMSFLDIASAVNIISEMNCNILRKEFSELNQSIKGSIDKIKILNKEISLTEFFREEFPPLLNKEGNEGRFLDNSPHPSPLLSKEKEGVNSKGHYSIGHRYSTRVGVQKGSTLMKALSDKIGAEARPQELRSSYAQDFDILKKQRRIDILNIIKTIGGNVTIKDIKDRIQKLQVKDSPLVSYGEKTLQRELVSMVKDSVLNKTGQKRWSRYFLK